MRWYYRTSSTLRAQRPLPTADTLGWQRGWGHAVDIHIDHEKVPVSYETDPSGEITAYNDDLGVMAVGPDRPTAAARFREALAYQLAVDLSEGRPLPSSLRSHVKTLVHA